MINDIRNYAGSLMYDKKQGMGAVCCTQGSHPRGSHLGLSPMFHPTLAMQLLPLPLPQSQPHSFPHCCACVPLHPCCSCQKPTAGLPCGPTAAPHFFFFGGGRLSPVSPFFPPPMLGCLKGGPPNVFICPTEQMLPTHSQESPGPNRLGPKDSSGPK